MSGNPLFGSYHFIIGITSFLEWKYTLKIMESTLKIIEFALKIIESTLKRVVQTTSLEWIPL